MKAIQKIFALVLVLLLCFGITACSENAPEVTTLPPRPTFGMPVVGVLYPGTYSISNTYSHSHYQSILTAMEKESMDPVVQLLAAENVAYDEASVRDAVAGLVDQGANIIISTEFNYSPYMQQIAEEYPSVIFCQLGSSGWNGQNLVDYFSEVYKSYYIAGCVAGVKSISEQTESIGFVSAYGTENPDAVSAVNAFMLGVALTNPNATVYLKVLSDPHNEEEEGLAAENLVLQQGCGILAQYTNTDATLFVGQYMSVPVCGPCYTDNITLDAVLVAPKLEWFDFYQKVLKAAQKTTYPEDFISRLGISRYYSLYDIQLPKGRKIEENIERIFEYAVGYVSTSAPTDPTDPNYNEDYFHNEGVFSGERRTEVEILEGGGFLSVTQEMDLVDSTGRVVVAAGDRSLTTEQIRTMDYYLDGIVLLSDGT